MQIRSLIHRFVLCNRTRVLLYSVLVQQHFLLSQIAFVIEFSSILMVFDVDYTAYIPKNFRYDLQRCHMIKRIIHPTAVSHTQVTSKKRNPVSHVKC